MNYKNYGALFEIRKEERKLQIKFAKDLIVELNKEGDIDTEKILMLAFNWMLVQNRITSIDLDLEEIECNHQKIN